MAFRIEIGQKIPIASLSKRIISVPDDIPKMASLINISNEMDQISERNNVKTMTIYYQNLKNCNLETDSIILEDKGKMVCFGRTWWDEEPDTTIVYGIFIVVHPDWRKRGIGNQVHQLLEDRVKEISLTHDPDKPKIIRISGQDTQKDKFKIATKFGYEAERYFFEMTRDLSEPIPEPAFPKNIEVRPVTEEHYRIIWEADGEAFKEHWGFVKPDEKDYQKWLKQIEELPERDPKLWKIAWDGDQFVGMVLNHVVEEENQLLGIKRGWTENICILKPWRRKGIASALINESMQMFKDMGMEETALGVDADNALNALKVYKDCGYEVLNTWVVFRKNLD